MAVYGFSVWYRGRTPEHELPVAKWRLSLHATAIAIILLASLASGYLLDTRTDAAFPYVDSLTTWSAVWATFLVARKVLENWWYWLVIDAASIFIYWSRDLPLTALLFVIYVIMIPFGLISWTRSWREATA
jgi:nicotinamide mononucleotide transporter